MAHDEENTEQEATAFIVVSEDDGASTRMLAEIQGLRQDVQKVEVGLSAVLGLEGLRSVLEHGFETNAEILKGFSEALKPPEVQLSSSEEATLAGLFATSAQPDFRNAVGEIPSAVDPTPPYSHIQFPAR